MQSLQFGPQATAVELLAVDTLPEAPTPAASLEADRERLLAHPLAFRDKVLFSTAGCTHLGFIAGLQDCQPLLTTVPLTDGDGSRDVPVVSPLIPVQWSHDGQVEPVQVHLLIGLKRQENAPDTRAERPPPKPAPAPIRQWLWVLAAFFGMTALSLTLGYWWSDWAAIAVTTGLISGGAVAGLLQDRVYGRVRPPVTDHPADAGFWDTVRQLANRQIATSALPGEWTAAAIPAGLAPRRDWSWEIGAVIVVLVTGVLLRWPPPQF